MPLKALFLVSEASGPILIKFNVNHHWVGGLIALGFGADCIKIVASMVTDRCHRLIMGKTKKKSLSLKPQSPELLYYLVVPIINCAIQGPGVKFGQTPGVDNLHRLTRGEQKVCGLCQ